MSVTKENNTRNYSVCLSAVGSSLYKFSSAAQACRLKEKRWARGGGRRSFILSVRLIFFISFSSRLSTVLFCPFLVDYYFYYQWFLLGNSGVAFIACAKTTESSLSYTFVPESVIHRLHLFAFSYENRRNEIWNRNQDCEAVEILWNLKWHFWNNFDVSYFMRDARSWRQNGVHDCRPLLEIRSVEKPTTWTDTYIIDTSHPHHGVRVQCERS